MSVKYIYKKYMQFMVARALLRNSVSIELAATTFVKGKMFFRNNDSTLDHSLFL